MLFLFSQEFSDDDFYDDLSNFWQNQPEVKEFTRDIKPIQDFSKNIIDSFYKNKSIIDETIKKYLHNWNFSRIGTVEKSILRISLAEFFFIKTDLPIIIKEAIKLVEIFCENSSKAFINGLLDKCFKQEKINGNI